MTTGQKADGVVLLIAARDSQCAALLNRASSAGRWRLTMAAELTEAMSHLASAPADCIVVDQAGLNQPRRDCIAGLRSVAEHASIVVIGSPEIRDADEPAGGDVQSHLPIDSLSVEWLECIIPLLIERHRLVKRVRGKAQCDESPQETTRGLRHDLRTCGGLIVLNIDLLLRKNRVTDPEALEILSNMRETMREMHLLIEQVGRWPGSSRE